MPSKQELGERIKRFRLERNLTLKEVELKANVSATHVSEIERGMTSPTVGALAKIAKALGTEPSYFLQNNAYPAVSVVRASDRSVFTYDNWGARISRLNAGIRDSQLSFLEVEIEPGLTHVMEPLSHTGEEFIHILKGVVEINVADSRYLLKEGDNLHYKSEDPHTIRNIGDGPSQILWVVSPPYQL